MKAKSALFPVLMVLSLIVCVVASPGRSYAGTPEGTVCFEDDHGDFWFLDFGSFLSGQNFDIHGFMTNSSVLCNGTFVQPVSGTATIDGDTIVVGVWSIATGPTCVSVSWQAVVDLSTFQSISGSFMTQLGYEGTFALSEIDCSSVLTAAKKRSQDMKGPAQRK